MCNENQWPKDALFPDLARGYCHRSRGGPASSSATGSHKRFILGSGFGRLPFDLSQELAGVRVACMHLIGSPRRFAKAEVQ